MPNFEIIKGVNFNCYSLDWDTNYFGISSARVDLNGIVNEEGQDRIIDYCNRYEFVTISNINNIKENNHWIGTRTNAFLADMNIQFIKVIGDIPRNQNDKTYVVNNLYRNERIVEIAKNSFQYSRFFNDPKLSEIKAKNIYLHWTECAFGQINKYFVVCEREGHIAGYILFSVNKNNSIIELVAVDKKYQGQGVAKSLINKMELFIVNQGINIIKVGTQVDNVPAVQFYTKMCFKHVSCAGVYHFWKS